MLNAMKCCQDVQHCCPSTDKIINVEFLYLDLSICERCQGSDKQVNEAIHLLRPILLELGYEIQVHKINVNTEALARQTHFFSSPTIKINGVDIVLQVEEDACVSCGDLCGDSVDCRVFTYQGKTYHDPPKAMIIDAILKSIYLPKTMLEPSEYVLPDNLKKFYDGQKRNIKSKI